MKQIDETTVEAYLTDKFRKNGTIPEVKMLASMGDATRYLRISAPEGLYVAKLFLLGERGRVMRRKMSDNPARFEYRLLKLFWDAGIRVPKPVPYSTPPEDNVLIMEDLGSNTIEKEMRTADKTGQTRLLKKVLSAMLKFHNTASQIQYQVMQQSPARIVTSSLPFRRALRYYSTLLTPEITLSTNRMVKVSRDEQFMKAFEVVAENVSGDAQLVHGDMTLYHAMMVPRAGKSDEDEVALLDLGSPKFLPITSDIAQVLFAPGVNNLNLEEKVNLFEEYVENRLLAPTTSGFLGLGKGSATPDYLKEQVKRFMFSVIFESLRAPAKLKSLALSPRRYEAFLNEHPNYGCVNHYIETARQAGAYMIEYADLNLVESKSLEQIMGQIADLLNGSMVRANAKTVSFGERKRIKDTDSETEAELQRLEGIRRSKSDLAGNSV